MKYSKDNHVFFQKDLIVDKNLTRSYLDESAIHQGNLYRSISQFGIITPVTAMRSNGAPIVITGVKRTFIASLLNIQVPVHFLPVSLSSREIFSVILADNLAQEFSFMDWAVLLRNLSFHKLEKEFTPLLQILQNTWKYPLHFTLVPAVFNLPQPCLSAIAQDKWSWQVVYYHHYFSGSEWEKIFVFFKENDIKKNLQRSFLENFIVFRQHKGPDKLHALLKEKGTADHFGEYFRKIHTPAYSQYREAIDRLQKELNRQFPGQIHLQDDPEEMSLDLRLRLKKKSDADVLQDLIAPLKEYWNLKDD